MGKDTMTRLKTATAAPTAYRPTSKTAARNCRHRLTIEVSSAPSECQAPEEAPRLRLAAPFLTGGRRFHDQRPDPAGRVGLGLNPGPQPALGPGQGIANGIFLEDREPRHRPLAGHERVTHPG